MNKNQNTQKKYKFKPNLVIQPLDQADFKRAKSKNALHRNQVDVKNVMSAKNNRQIMKNFDFSQNNLQMINTQRKLKALKRLESQKVDLMRSLQILKQGAVSAIIQKQDEILKLKEQIYTNSTEKQLKLYEKQLQLQHLYQKQLQEQKEDLRRQMKREKLRFLSELEEKQQLIEQLHHSLNQSYQRIDNLQRCDELMSQKIKILELQNSTILQQLQTSRSFTLNNSNITISHPRIPTFQYDENMLQDQTFQMPVDVSVASTIPKRAGSTHLFDDEQHLNHSIYSQRICMIQQQHRQQMQELKRFYQTRIEGLRQIYHKQLLSANGENKLSLNQDHFSQTNDLESAQKDKEFMRSRNNSAGVLAGFDNTRTLSKNNSIQTNLKIRAMQAIDEREQHENNNSYRCYDETSYNPRLNNLKDQIIQNSKIYDYVSLSGKNQDTKSQFTNRYFQYPFSKQPEKLFRKTSSVATFEGKQVQDQSNPNKQSQNDHSRAHSQSESIYVNMNPQFNRNQNQNDDKNEKVLQKWKSHMIFCAGILTGGTLFSIGSKFLKLK